MGKHVDETRPADRLPEGRFPSHNPKHADRPRPTPRTLESWAQHNGK